MLASQLPGEGASTHCLHPSSEPPSALSRSSSAPPPLKLLWWMTPVTRWLPTCPSPASQSSITATLWDTPMNQFWCLNQYLPLDLVNLFPQGNVCDLNLALKNFSDSSDLFILNSLTLSYIQPCFLYWLMWVLPFRLSSSGMLVLCQCLEAFVILQDSLQTSLPFASKMNYLSLLVFCSWFYNSRY